MTPAEIKELIYNAKLDYSNLNIKDNRVVGYINVFVDEEEMQELSNIPYFYLDSFEVDINKYYAESLGVIRLNESEFVEYYDVEFHFRKKVA